MNSEKHRKSSKKARELQPINTGEREGTSLEREEEEDNEGLITQSPQNNLEVLEREVRTLKEAQKESQSVGDSEI